MKNCSKTNSFFFSKLLFCLSILSLRNLQSSIYYQKTILEKYYILFEETQNISNPKMYSTVRIC